MPIISQAISELQTHVYKPVIDQLALRILQKLGYDRVVKDRIYINTDFSTHSQTSSLANDAEVDSTAFRIEASVKANPASQKWDCYTFHHTAAYGLGQIQLNETFSTYIDKKNLIRIKEYRSPVTIEMNCELVLSSADLAYQVPQALYNAYDNGAIIEYVDLVFDYPVPKAIANTLHAFWKLDRVNGECTGTTFEQYLSMHTDGTHSWQIRRSGGGDYELIVPVYDLRALFSVEYSEDKPNANKEERMPTSYTISFTCNVQFGLPSLNILQYPVVLTNRLLPQHLIRRDYYSRFNRLPERHVGHADEYYEKIHNRKYYPRITQTPFYDEWKVPTHSNITKYNHEPILIMHLLVDETPDLTTTIDLKEIKDPNYGLSPSLKEILYQQGEESLEYDAIYTVALFKDDKQLKPYDDYTFNEDLELKFKATDLSAHYRLVICSPTTMYAVRMHWWPLMKQHFPYLSMRLQRQMEAMLQPGELLHDPKYPKRVYISVEGNIYDAKYHRFIQNIRDNKYPLHIGDNHAHHPNIRVITGDLITYRSNRSKARTAK